MITEKLLETQPESVDLIVSLLQRSGEIPEHDTEAWTIEQAMTLRAICVDDKLLKKEIASVYRKPDDRAQAKHSRPIQ